MRCGPIEWAEVCCRGVKSRNFLCKLQRPALQRFNVQAERNAIGIPTADGCSLFWVGGSLAAGAPCAPREVPCQWEVAGPLSPLLSAGRLCLCDDCIWRSQEPMGVFANTRISVLPQLMV